MIKNLIKHLFGSKDKQIPSSKPPRANKNGPLTKISHRHTAKKLHINPQLIPESATTVAKTLHEHGFSAYIVGGAVRDLICGVEPKDFDIATDARPEEIVKCFRRARIIGRRFKIVHVHHKRDLIEVSTFRALNADDQEIDEHGRVLRDNSFGDIHTDAARRDLTINALYLDVKKNEVLDFHGGVKDLEQKNIRIIGQPDLRFREDPVRMLRALRFEAKLGFEIESETLGAIHQNKELLFNIPQARLLDETLKFFTTGHALHSLHTLISHEFMPYLFALLAKSYQGERGQGWIEAVLKQTDARVEANKSISPGFLYAALLWPLVEQKWIHYQKTEPLVVALDHAATTVISQLGEQAVTKRFISDMREIWSLQPRLHKRVPKQVWSIVDHERYRAGYDFFLLRAQLGHLDETALDIANWWDAFHLANESGRAQLIESLKRAPRNLSEPAQKKRRRRPKSKSKSDAVTVGQTPGNSKSD